MKYPIGKKEKGQFTLIDDEDASIMDNYTWYIDGRGYVTTTCSREEQRRTGVLRRKLHRLIMNVPKVLEVDHVNHDLLDNRKQNLRICTKQQNLLNKRKTWGSSRYKGVSWYARDKNWLSKITFSYKQYYLGYYDTEEEAAKAYDIKAKELFGEFAKFNFDVT